jgi:hypothetical protein
MKQNDFDRYRRRTHFGRAPVKDQKSALEEALENAYEAAKADGHTPPFRVEAIILDGNNPLTDYIVEISTGH